MDKHNLILQAHSRLNELASAEENEEQRRELFSMVRKLRFMFPEAWEDPIDAEIKRIFEDFPKDGKYLRREVYEHYMNRATQPLSPHGFWPRFRNLFRVCDCYVRLGSKTYRAMVFYGQYKAPETDPLPLVCLDEHQIASAFSVFPRGERVKRADVYAEYCRIGGARTENGFWKWAGRCANFVDGRDSDDSTIIIH